MKNWAAKILTGFLIGLGFSASFLGIYFYVTNQMQEKVMARFTTGTENIKNIEFIKHTDTKLKHKLLIIGSLKNNSAEPVNNIKLEAEFFKDGEFVDECTEYLGNKIGPGQIENFKVACGCSNDFVAPEYDNYTLRVTSIVD